MSIYDIEPPMGQFIKIESGKFVKLRLVGEGHTFNKDFNGEVSQRFLSVVLYRNTTLKTSEVKVFEFGWGIMGQINKLYNDKDDFGPVDQYDIKVSREGEGKQSRYTVQALPKSPLTAEEKALIAAAKIDLAAIAGSKAVPVAATGTEETYDPFADQ